MRVAGTAAAEACGAKPMKRASRERKRWWRVLGGDIVMRTQVLSKNLRGGLFSCFEHSNLQQRWLSKLIADACALGLF